MTTNEVMCWLLLPIATERLTELFVSSEFFAGVRNFLFVWAFGNPTDPPKPATWHNWFKGKVHKLATCGYCLSVWVSGFFAFYHVGHYVDNHVFDWFVKMLVIHGMSNMIHTVYELIRRGRVKSYDITVNVNDITPKVECPDGTVRESIGAGSDPSIV